MRRVAVGAAVFAMMAIAIVDGAQKQKMSPEELVKLHLQALTAGVPVPRQQMRDVKGTVAAVTPARAAGLLPGTFRLISSPTAARLNLHFGTDRYEGETFTLEGDKVDVANAQPVTGSRSAVGNFVARNPVIVAEGLIGGVLNARWPLHDVAARKSKLSYEGLKTLSGRELHRLRYRAKDNQGSLDIELYFDPASYRHVATVYATSQSQQLGATPEMSSQQADQYFRIEERFGRFEAVGDVTVPKSWSLRFERSGNTANEWKYDMTVQTIEVTGPPGQIPSSQSPTPKAIPSHNVLWELGVARRRVSTLLDDTLWRGLAVAPGNEGARRRRRWALTSAGVP